MPPVRLLWNATSLAPACRSGQRQKEDSPLNESYNDLPDAKNGFPGIKKSFPVKPLSLIFDYSLEN